MKSCNFPKTLPEQRTTTDVYLLNKTRFERLSRKVAKKVRE